MQLRHISLSTCACLLTLVQAQFGYYPSSDGGLRLVGSSFGVVGMNATFDYVVIGGGTAGLVVANRLSAVPGVSVAVVEAGSFYEISNSNHSQIPAFDYLGTTGAASDVLPLADWGVITKAQVQLDGREIHYAQGKCFGGGSARNYLAYQRGTIGSYQKWADLVDDQSFTFSNLLPFLRKSVNFTVPNYVKREAGGPVLYNVSGFEPQGGPLHVSYPNYWAPIATFLQKSFSDLGFNPIHGFNTGQLLGYGEFTSSIDPAAETRSSAETSFLQDSITSPLLQIFPQTLVERILFDSSKTATGVRVSTSGFPFTLFARKEVILSAGAFRSPQMLMLSGIGPSKTLQSLKIPAVSVLEGLGQNLWDQPYFGTTYQVNVTTQSALSENATYAAEATQEFLSQQKGPLTLPGGSVAGFEKLPDSLRANLSSQAIKDLATFPSDWPELEILPIGAAGGSTNGSGNYIALNIAVVATTSRGNVTINSTNPQDNPIVSPNWLLSSTDQQVAVQAIKRARQIAVATDATIGPEILPGPAIQSDAEILSYLRQTVGPIHHASATCAMGKKGDPNAVVDSRGRVFGVQSLRVIDASAFPFLPPGHPQSNVYMLAEKLVQDIIRDNEVNATTIAMV